MTYAEVEQLINARLYPPPILQPTLSPPQQQTQFATTSGQQSMLSTPMPLTIGQDPIQYQHAHDPLIPRLAYEAGEPRNADISCIEEELGMPRNPKFTDLLNRARVFDQPEAMGGWHPRPPPTPWGPLIQAPKSYAQQRKDDQTYRSRVRRAQVPHDQQKRDAWHVLQRRIFEASQVLGWVIIFFVNCAQLSFGNGWGVE